MGIIDRFIDKRVQSKLAPIVKELQQKSISFANLSNYGIRQSVYSSLRFDITNSDTLYAIIRKRVMKEAAVPLLVYKKKSDKKNQFTKYLAITKGAQNAYSFQKSVIYRAKALDEVTVDNDLSTLLARPSFTMGADAFWQGVFYQYAFGEAFIRKNRGGSLKGKPIELELLHSKSVEVVPVSLNSTTVSHYIYSAGTGTVRIEKDDMIHWKSYNPKDPLRGFDPLEPLKRRLTQDEALTDASMYSANNGGASGVFFPKDLNLTETQTTQITDVLKNKTNNVKTRNSVEYLPAEFGYIDLSRSTAEMQLLEQLGWTFERICHAFGIPPVIFKTDSAFANQEWGQKNWITNDIMTVVFSLRDTLNRFLVPDFEGGLFIDSDFTALPELQEDMKKLVDGLTPFFDRGAINPDEMRSVAGWDETGDPLHQIYYIQSGYTPLSDMTLQPDTVDPNAKNYGDY